MANKILIEQIRADLRNNIESGQLTPMGQLMAINDALKWLSTLNNEKINQVIQKYREEQQKQEKIQTDAQIEIMKNAKNIYNNILEL